MSAENNTLNIEAGPPQDHTKNTSPSKWPLLLLCCLFVAIGIVGGPLLLRFYYLNGGTRKWLISFLQTAAFPILIPPISLLITLHASNPNNLSSSLLLEPKLILSSACMGMLYGFINFLYSQGLSYLPASTSTLLQSTQLIFVAVFSRLIVKQKFTAYTMNSLVLTILGSIMLGIRANADRPVGVSTGNYWLGFFLTLLSAFLTGVMWPTVELSYRKATRAVTQATLLQYQLNVSVFATLFCLVGMAVSRDFQPEIGHGVTKQRGRRSAAEVRREERGEVRGAQCGSVGSEERRRRCTSRVIGGEGGGPVKEEEITRRRRRPAARDGAAENVEDQRQRRTDRRVGLVMGADMALTWQGLYG
ncbi:hypothetical protein Syun_018574 [Stephania yunnanensis]|uniref:Probable purine permease n=1 Tax=Stephania yunnanensis TaxID=152371 RepID=A0AAP0ISH4_9MAGN